MKKVLGVLLVGLMLCATGCGGSGKKLECQVDMLGIHQDVIAKFDSSGKNIKSLEMTMTYGEAILKSAGVTDATRDEFINENVNSVCDQYDYEGMKCEVKDTGKDIKVVITVADFDKLGDDAASIGFGNDTYDNLKSDLEAMSYTCK